MRDVNIGIAAQESEFLLCGCKNCRAFYLRFHKTHQKSIRPKDMEIFVDRVSFLQLWAKSLSTVEVSDDFGPKESAFILDSLTLRGR